MTCAVVECNRERQRFSLFCSAHLDECWANRLTRNADGTYAPVAEWVRRARDRQMRPKELTR